MEILQTIWNALISENEFVMNIISVPCIFLEAYLYMLIFLTLLKINSIRKQRIIFVVSFAIISLLNIFFVPTPYYTFINVLSMPILVFFIFKTNVLRAILSEVFTYILILLLSTVLMMTYSGILNLPSTAIATIPIHKLCGSILLYVSLYICYMLFKKFNINISLMDKFKHRISLLLILNFIIGSVAIGLECYLLFNYIDFIPNILIFSSLFVLLLYFSISIFSLVRTNKLEITTQSLEEQKMYNQTLTTLHDNIRGFKHDFDNIIQAIGGYLSTDNIDGLRTYYKDLLEECQINNNLSVLNPELINNPVIYSLLADKYYTAEELGIKINLEVIMDLSNLNIKSYELARILGILLDNAVEAAAKCEEKIINITFRKGSNRNISFIIIQNTYTNKDVVLNEIFEKGYTSKQIAGDKKDHGLGLWEVRKYLKKNTHLDLYTTKSDKFFSQQFEIYN